MGLPQELTPSAWKLRCVSFGTTWQRCKARETPGSETPAQKTRETHTGLETWRPRPKSRHFIETLNKVATF